MNDKLYDLVVNHYMNQCGCLTDLWLTYTMDFKWHELAIEEGMRV